MRSPSDIPITIPPHGLVRDSRGVATWRPVLTTLSVHGVPGDDNGRHLVVHEDGEERFRFVLTGADARHVADLLVEPMGAEVGS